MRFLSNTQLTETRRALKTFRSRNSELARRCQRCPPFACEWSGLTILLRRAAAHHRAQCPNEFRGRGFKLVPVRQRELPKQRGACRSQLHDHLAAVRFAPRTRHGSERFEAVHKLHGAVMTQAQTASQLADGGAPALWQPSNGQQQLMLLRFEAVGSRLSFTEMEKSSDSITEFGKSPVLGKRQIVHNPS
jgi:hypothetical protein